MSPEQIQKLFKDMDWCLYNQKLDLIQSLASNEGDTIWKLIVTEKCRRIEALRNELTLHTPPERKGNS